MSILKMKQTLHKIFKRYKETLQMKITHKFKLADDFLDQYKRKQPKWGPLGYVTYKRTYSRMMENGKSEEYYDTVRRVVEGVFSIQKTHCKSLKLPWSDYKAQKSAQEMFHRMWEFKFLPPGRGLWMMGTDFVERAGGAALNNCGFVSTEQIKTDFSGPFRWLMEMSMLGVGVGFDTKGEGTVKIKEPKVSASTYVVEDSREGWCDLVGSVLDSYVGKGSMPKEIDYSQIRDAGEPIKGFGGVSSGYAPLKELVDSLIEELEKHVGTPISSELIVDIANLIGRCVVSGNIRRSAEIAFGDPNDESFLNLKNPELNGEKVSGERSYRWASNNSVYAEIGMDYSKVAELTAMNGEPGYLWLENARNFSRMNCLPDFSDTRAAGANPCVEQTLESFELCCLCETFPVNHDDIEDYLETLKYAYLYAKSVTLIPTHDERTNNVMLRNRRIGMSMSGIVQAMKKFSRRKFFDYCGIGYDHIRDLDDMYSEWLCVPKSRKVTSVKPSGTISLLPGVTPGIHFPHSEYYIRRIRFQEGSSLLVSLEKAGYKIEKDVYSPNTYVVEFPVREEYFDRCKTDVSMWEQLEIAAQVQQYWADNQVSATITFSQEEAKDIKYALELYETRLKGISFLPLSDHGYEQAPYEEITADEYEAMTKNINRVNKIREDTHEKDEKFCDSDVCEIDFTAKQ
jgi:adenosylcobalamin-dependent ribonucleoside-triphosphate reductase